MTITIEGKVTGVGQIKAYGDNYYGVTYKFFMAVLDDAGVEHKCMVQVERIDAPEFRDDEDRMVAKSETRETKERRRPFRGDRVKYTTRSNSNGWESATLKQTYEITDHAGYDEWKVWKAEQERLAAIEEAKRVEAERIEAENREKERVAAEAARIAHIAAKLDACSDKALVSTVKLIVEGNKSLSYDRLVRVLEDIYWLGPLPVGIGGKRADIDYYSGTSYGDAYPGTGMRRPDGCMYETPKTIRSKILGLIEGAELITKVVVGEATSDEPADAGDEYDITENGRNVLRYLDTCDECHTMKRAYGMTSSYSRDGRTGWMETNYARFMCECEKAKFEESTKGQEMCNHRTYIRAVGKDRFEKTEGGA